MVGIINIQHNTSLHRTWVCRTWTLDDFNLMFESCIKLILHIKEMVCCCVPDGSPRSHACVVEETSRLGCSCWTRSIAPG